MVRAPQHHTSLLPPTVIAREVYRNTPSCWKVVCSRTERFLRQKENILKYIEKMAEGAASI